MKTKKEKKTSVIKEKLEEKRVRKLDFGFLALTLTEP